MDPNDRRIHTNNIENKWSKLRRFVKRNVNERFLEIYINNFLFFFHTEDDQRYTVLVNLIKNNPEYFKF